MGDRQKFAKSTGGVCGGGFLVFEFPNLLVRFLVVVIFGTSLEFSGQGQRLRHLAATW